MVAAERRLESAVATPGRAPAECAVAGAALRQLDDQDPLGASRDDRQVTAYIGVPDNP